MNRILFLMLLIVPVANLPGQEKSSDNAEKSSDNAKSELERFQQSDAPKTLADLRPEMIDTKDDAAWWLRQSVDGRLAINMALATDFEFDSPCNAEFLRKYKEVVGKHPNTLIQTQTAANAKSYFPDARFDVATFQEFSEQMNMDEMRSAGYVLMYKSAVELAEGNDDAAAATALSILKLATKRNVHYGMIGFQMRMAVSQMGTASLNNALQSGREIEEATLESIRQFLDEYDILGDFQASIVEERVIGIQLMKDQKSYSPSRIEAYLKLMRLAEEGAVKTKAEQPELVDLDGKNWVAATVLPGLQMSRQSAQRQLTKWRCLRILIELNDQHDDEQDLNEFELPESMKTDPVSGDHLIVRKVKNGWLVYGVGINGVDDGGQVDIVTDYGIAPMAKTDDD